MLVYIVLPIVSIFIFFLLKLLIRGEVKFKKTFLALSGLILFAVIAFRDKSLGSTDSVNYYNNWQYLSGLTFSQMISFMTGSNIMEYGYIIVVWLLSHVFYSPQWCFIFSGFFFSVSVCIFIYKNSKDVLLSFIMYICLFYTFMVQGLRQSIAMFICLFAVEPAKKRQFIKFALLIILAWFFHRSSIVFSVAYLFYWKRFDIKCKTQMIIFAALAFCVSPLLVKYGNILTNREYYDGVFERGGYVSVAIYVLIIIFAFLFIKNNDNHAVDKNLLFYEKDRTTVFFVAMTVVGGCFYIMRYFLVDIMERVSFYFVFGQYILLPDILSRFDKTSRVIIKGIVIVLCILLYAYRLSRSNLIPYKFFWE